jgi:hypothetical protein
MTPARTAARNVTPARTAARNVTPAGTAAARTTPPARNAPARPAAANPDPMATPPPHTPLPPARARGYTPWRSGQPAAAPQDVRTADSELTPIATPPPRAADPRTAPAPGRPTPPGRQTPSAREALPPNSTRSTQRGSAPVPTLGRPSPSMPAVAGGPQRQTGPRPAIPPETPAYGVQRPPAQDFARARTVATPGGLGRVSPAMNHAAIPVANRVHHETARVQFREPRRWGRVFMLLIVLLAGAGFVVHRWFIPLDVLIAWRQPTGLSIATEPPGAKLRLDGVPLAATAPTTVTVWRDRADHVVEATHPGYQVARESIRYDRSTSLSFVLRLQPAPASAPGPSPSPTGPGRPR